MVNAVPSSTETPAANLETSGEHQRKKAHVLTIAVKIRITKWMIEEAKSSGSEAKISSKAIRAFPQFFPGSSSAKHMRAGRLWKAREILLSSVASRGSRGDTHISTVRSETTVGVRRANLKCQRGRGRKRSPWVVELQEDLVNEFSRLRKAGVKFSARTLRHLALRMLDTFMNPAYKTGMLVECRRKVNSKVVPFETPMQELICPRWVRIFIKRFNVVSRTQSGKLQLGPAAQEMIEKRVAYFLGTVAREFMSGRLNEDDVENSNEAHFVVNYDNGKTLGFWEDSEVRYADVVSGGEGMTMMVRLTGGSSSFLASPFMILQEEKGNYPIRSLPDDIPGVSYRTGPRGWIDRRVMVEWLRETRNIRKLPDNRRRVLFMENCSAHNMTENLKAALDEISTEIRFFPANSTHLLQPADSFIIQKLKSAWNRTWEAHKLTMMRDVLDPETFDTASGKIPNPGQRFFLELAAKSVMEVNQQRDEDGLTFARKAMIRCGLAKQSNGMWEVRQLFPHLQTIVSKHKVYFDGLDPDAPQAEPAQPEASSPPGASEPM